MPPVSTSTPCLGEARIQQRLGERGGAVDRALLALLERLTHRDAEGDGLRGDHVLERAALLAGEHRRVDLLGVLLAAEDETGTRATERLVDGGGDDVGVRHRVGVQARGDEACEVGHVDHEVGADLVGDLAETCEVELARVGRPASDDELRLGLEGEALDLVHVDPVRLGIDLVGGDLVETAGDVELHAVAQVATVCERQAEDAIARLEQRVEDGGVRLGAGVRLHVGVLGAEELLGTVDRELLADVDELAPTVVALAG